MTSALTDKVLQDNPSVIAYCRYFSSSASWLTCIRGVTIRGGLETDRRCFKHEPKMIVVCTEY